MEWVKIGNIKGPKGNQGKSIEGPRGPGGYNGRNGIGVPAGGSLGQVLTKASATDYDTYWADPGSGGPATEAPKLIATFNTTSATAVGDLVKVTGTNTVEKINNNSSAEIPNGIFGVAFSKPTSITVQVIFVGIIGGLSGLTAGNPIYISVTGEPTQTAPITGIWQQIGFAVSSTEYFVTIKTPLEQ